MVVPRVARYDTLGFVEELPSINIERWDHGCGAYMRDDGIQVRREVFMKGPLPYHNGNFLLYIL